MVEKAKETSAKEIYFGNRTLSFTQRSKTVVLPMDRKKVRTTMSKKRISRKCIDCKNCSAPSVIKKDGKRKIVYRCEAGVFVCNIEEFLIDDKTVMNCIKFSRK